MKYVLLIHRNFLNHSGFISDFWIVPSLAYFIWTNEKKSLMLTKWLTGLKVTGRIKFYKSTKIEMLIALVGLKTDVKS